MHTRVKKPGPPTAPVTGEPATRPEPSARPPHLPLWANRSQSPGQARLPVNRPDDAAEQEAGRVAQNVVTPATDREGPGARPLAVQRDPEGGGAPQAASAPPAVHDVVRNPGQPLPPAERAFMEGRFGQDFSGVQVHADAKAAESARTIRANAYTVGPHIVFGPGRYAPYTSAGRKLLAHELTHVVQQAGSGAPAVQRDTDVVQMPTQRVASTLQPASQAVSNLSSLTGQGVTPGGITLAYDPATLQRNAPDAAAVLPFRAGGWDADAIATRLGQYDTLPGTDSDAIRCVQAVAMVSRIVQGPQAVISYLRATILDGMMSRPMGQRERTAIKVLEHVIGRIETQRATFGDLLFAQEALHDLFYNDVSGTPQSDFAARIAPSLDLSTTLQPLNIWCNSPADVIAQANRLQPGEQLLVNTWQVIFNSAFDDLSEQGIEVREGDSIQVTINGRRRNIRRIPIGTRPSSSIIDPNRDRQLGHQLLVFRDGATRTLRLYEPEVTTSGQHLEGLAADGSNFQRYFNDLPSAGIYNYIQILGKITPASWPASTSFTTP